MRTEEINELVARDLLGYGDDVAFHLDNGFLLEGIVVGLVRSGSDVLIVSLAPAEDPEGDVHVHVPVSSIRAVQNLGKIAPNE